MCTIRTVLQLLPSISMFLCDGGTVRGPLRTHMRRRRAVCHVLNLGKNTPEAAPPFVSALDFLGWPGWLSDFVTEKWIYRTDIL